MSAVKALNPKAEVTRAAQALQLNITAARGLQEVMRTNLGPKGTMKMYVLNCSVHVVPRVIQFCTRTYSTGWYQELVTLS